MQYMLDVRRRHAAASNIEVVNPSQLHTIIDSATVSPTVHTYPHDCPEISLLLYPLSFACFLYKLPSVNML